MAVRNSSFQSIPLDRLNRVMNSLEFTILSVLKDRSALEGAENRLYVKDISQWLNVPAARLSPIFTKLEEEGYIRWESDERLGASYVALTDYGKEKAGRTAGYHGALLRACHRPFWQREGERAGPAHAGAGERPSGETESYEQSGKRRRSRMNDAYFKEKAACCMNGGQD